MEQEDNLKLMLGGFIAILVGVVLLGPIADSIAALDVTVPLLNNQSFAWPENNTRVAFDDNDVITSTVVAYANNTKMGLTTNYSVDGIGITILNRSAGTGEWDLFVYNVSYTHEGNEYVADKNSKTLLNITIIFFAIGIMAVGVLIVIKAFDKMDF